MTRQVPASVDTALILAAGAGRRLGELSARQPKMFLEVDGRRLIDYQLAYLEARGVETVIMATGHMHDLVVETLGGEQRGMRLLYAENESYRCSGSAWSLLGCREIWSASPSDVLFLHSDIFYDPAILDLVLSSEHPTVIALDDGYQTLTQDEVVVTGSKRAVEGIHRETVPAADFVGELVGIHRFSRDYLTALFDFLSVTLSPSNRSHHYEFLAVELGRQRDPPMGYVSTRRRPWVNINYREDLEYARALVASAMRRQFAGS